MPFGISHQDPMAVLAIQHLMAGGKLLDSSTSCLPTFFIYLVAWKPNGFRML
jgi:hypothetical protein